MKILVFGGDARQLYMAQALGTEGFLVDLCGFDSRCNQPFPCRAPERLDYAGYDMIIFPIPVSKDQRFFHLPLFDREIPLETVLHTLCAGQTVVGGMFPEDWKRALSNRGIRVFDFCDREEFSIRNAIPAAEGAIALAMNETPFTLHGAECLVVGNGKVGKMLSKMLCGIGAKVTVSARKNEDLAWIAANAQTPLPTQQLEREAERFDVIFNTVPHPILNGNVLRRVKKHCLLIDLASKPGGIDFECAKTLGLNTVWALSLPGTVAPETAGIIMKDIIMDIDSECRNPASNHSLLLPGRKTSHK